MSKPNLSILIGSGAFVAVTFVLGLSSLPGKMEIICLGSLAVIVYLMAQLLRGTDPAQTA